MIAPSLLLDTAEECSRWLIRYGVTPRQLRQWAKRGHITRYSGDLYEAMEVVAYLEGRPERDKRRAEGVTRCAESRRLTL